MAVSVRTGLYGLQVSNHDNKRNDERIANIIILDNDESSALASLLAEVHDTEPRLHGTLQPRYIAPNHHEALLAIRKAAYGY